MFFYHGRCTPDHTFTKRSALRSRRRKGTPFQSAMSMLGFYTNRAGSNLTVRRKNILMREKTELHRLFRRPAYSTPRLNSRKISHNQPN
jgi:hypothetical protein